jgi:hypothetical protein
MTPLVEIWEFFSKHYEAIGVIVAALVAVGGGVKWLLSRKPPPPSGGETVHGPKVGGGVGGDAVGHDKTTVHGDQVGRDRHGDRTIHGHHIQAGTVIIQQSAESAAKAVSAAASRFQLPARNPDFVGRRDKIDEIKTVLRAGAAQVTALEGLGGIGKTDTATEAAHELVEEGRFKDAQLFIDLQGFSATGRPLAPVDALRKLLRPFVTAEESLPEGVQELAGRFREVTQGLDMLLFLDNVRDDEQVVPLLPGHSACTVLVTSRNRLSLRGLKPIDLAEMDPEEAKELALRLANRRDRNRITEAQAAEIVRLCGCLPLSIEVTANALSKSQGADVAGYLKTLGDRTKPLKALEKVKAVLRLSVEALDEETRSRWAALGVFEGGFDAKAAAAVWAVEEAGGTLEELEQRSLVSFDRTAQRYHLHDLLRAVALEELARDPARQQDVLRRHSDHFFDRALQSLEVADLLNWTAGAGWRLDMLEGRRKYVVAMNENFELVSSAAVSSANAYMRVGKCYSLLGEKGRSVGCFVRALALYREIGARQQISEVCGLLRAAGVDPDSEKAAE